MGEDVTKLGCDLLAKKTIFVVPEEKCRIIEQKTPLKECIANHLNQQAVNTPVNFFEPTPNMGSWQRHVRTTKNNLQSTIQFFILIISMEIIRETLSRD